MMQTSIRPTFTSDYKLNDQLEVLALANELAWTHALDPQIRGLASEITQYAKRLPWDTSYNWVQRSYAYEIFKWIHQNIRYTQEAPFGELLQGPYTTLPKITLANGYSFDGFGIGDCDDLSILFASLLTSLGSKAYVAGIGFSVYPKSLYHAKGFCNGIFYELSEDEDYGGDPDKPLVHTGVPSDQFAIIYCPTTKTYTRMVS